MAPGRPSTGLYPLLGIYTHGRQKPSKLAIFRDVLFCMIEMDYSGQFMTILDSFGQFWTILDSYGQFWTILDNFGHFWTKVDRI